MDCAHGFGNSKYRAARAHMAASPESEAFRNPTVASIFFYIPSLPTNNQQEKRYGSRSSRARW